MRIVHLYKNYDPIVGGIENHCKVLAESQAARGHDVTVLVANGKPTTSRDELNGVKVIRAGCLANVASTPLAWAMPFELARLRPDVAHLHYPYPVGEVSQWLAGKSRATVLSYHSDVVKQQTIMRFYRPLLQRVMRKVDRILVATPNYLASSVFLQDYRDKCQVLPYGIDRAPFLTSDRAEAQALHGKLAGDNKLIVFVGVLRYYKGLRYLLDAMAALPDIDAHLALVGDGPERAALTEQAAQLGIADHITFCGRISDAELPLYYRAADLFVLPASERSEAFGLVQVEAMASAAPLISTELGTGTSWVNAHNESGLVVEAKSGPALAEAIGRILSDDALRQRLAKGSLERSELFDAPRMVDDIMAVYKELLGPSE